jgi:hypothetical protein
MRKSPANTDPALSGANADMSPECHSETAPLSSA